VLLERCEVKQDAVYPERRHAVTDEFLCPGCCVPDGPSDPPEDRLHLRGGRRDVLVDVRWSHSVDGHDDYLVLGDAIFGET